MDIRQFLKRKASEDVSTSAARSGPFSAKQSDSNMTDVCAVKLSPCSSAQSTSPHDSREPLSQTPTNSGDFVENIETFQLSVE